MLPDTSTIFFSATTIQDESYVRDDIIKFPKSLTNEHPEGTGSWDEDTSIFTCPVGGHYLIIVSLFKPHGGYNHQAVLRTSEQGDVVELRSYQGAGTTTNFSSTMSAILPCQTGEEVYCIFMSIFIIVHMFYYV